jgi:hypothetical protein
MDSDPDGLTPNEYMEESRTPLPRETFDNRFRTFLTRYAPEMRPTVRQGDGFYKIASGYRREDSRIRTVRTMKAAFLRDYQRSEKLMDTAEQMLRDFKKYFRDVAKKCASPNHSTLAQADVIVRETTDFEAKLKQRFLRTGT